MIDPDEAFPQTNAPTAILTRLIIVIFSVSGAVYLFLIMAACKYNR